MIYYVFTTYLSNFLCFSLFIKSTVKADIFQSSDVKFQWGTGEKQNKKIRKNRRKAQFYAVAQRRGFPIGMIEQLLEKQAVLVRITVDLVFRHQNKALRPVSTGQQSHEGLCSATIVQFQTTSLTLTSYIRKFRVADTFTDGIKLGRITLVFGFPPVISVISCEVVVEANWTVCSRQNQTSLIYCKSLVSSHLNLVFCSLIQLVCSCVKSDFIRSPMLGLRLIFWYPLHNFYSLIRLSQVTLHIMKLVNNKFTACYTV